MDTNLTDKRILAIDVVPYEVNGNQMYTEDLSLETFKLGQRFPQASLFVHAFELDQIDDIFSDDDDPVETIFIVMTPDTSLKEVFSQLKTALTTETPTFDPFTPLVADKIIGYLDETLLP